MPSIGRIQFNRYTVYSTCWEMRAGDVKFELKVLSAGMVWN